MSYFVETQPLVVSYLAAIECLTKDELEAIVDAYVEELGRDADRFLALYPLRHESLHFRYNYPHLTSKTLFVFDFIVDGSEMPSGIVRVVYVEHTTEPIS